MTENDNPDDFEQGAEEDFSEETEQAPAKPAKKKSGGFFALVVILLLAGGAVVAAPFLGIPLPFSLPGIGPVPKQAAVSPPARPPGAGTAQAPVQNPAAATPQLPSVPAENTLPPSSEDLGSLYGAAPEPVAPAEGSQVPAVTGFAAAMPPAIESLPGEQEAPAIAPPDTGLDPLAAPPPSFAAAPSFVADPLAAPSSPEAPTASLPEVSPVAEEASSASASAEIPAPALTQAPAVAAADESIAALDEKVDALEKKITEMQESLASKEDLEEIKAALEALEKGMASKKNAEALKAAKREVENYRNGVMPDVVRAETVFSEPAPRKTEAKKKPPQEEPLWILKSAKPGVAWVSRKGSSELKTVSVGDDLQGIGKVTAIVKDSTGRWVINGTRGFIPQ